MNEQQTFIGEWVRRSGEGSRKVHLVESEVTDRLVMRCGRQMRLQTKRGVLTVFGRFSRAIDPWCDQCGQP